MAKGAKCPGCGSSTYHDDGSVRKCSGCGYIGWSWKHIPKEMGSGRGNTCPECNFLTLHDVIQINDQLILRRCSICNYTAIQPI
ncbi:MAG: hypothetical protein ACYDEJ_02270 [Desulfitobacteriaceae bacterium]